jgi:hypothetical protein
MMLGHEGWTLALALALALALMLAREPDGEARRLCAAKGLQSDAAVGVDGPELTRAKQGFNPPASREQCGVPLSPVAELHDATAETGLQPQVQLLLMLELSLIELDSMNRERFDSLHEIDEVAGECEAQEPTPRPDRRALERCSDDIRVREPERDSRSRQRACLDRCDGRVCRSSLGAEQAGDERAQEAEHPKTGACATGVEP